MGGKSGIYPHSVVVDTAGAGLAPVPRDPFSHLTVDLCGLLVEFGVAEVIQHRGGRRFVTNLEEGARLTTM